MSTKRKRQAPNPTGLIITLLGLVALLGLLSGFLAHTLVSRSQASAQVSPSATSRTQTSPTNSSAAVPSAGATDTVPASTVTGQFQLSVSITPKKMKPGQQFT